LLAEKEKERKKAEKIKNVLSCMNGVVALAGEEQK